MRARRPPLLVVLAFWSESALWAGFAAGIPPSAMVTMTRWGLGIAAFAAITGVGSSAHAGPPAERHPGQHHAEFPNLLGLRAGYFSIVESRAGKAAYFPGLLAGVSYERLLIHEWLELEVAVPVALVFAECLYRAS